ncbi:hypothetical protein BFW90_19365 [Pseudomonas fluorescens]|nr:hypothetical protein BFW90_19365 [Pseudomonas fluorescens]
MTIQLWEGVSLIPVGASVLAKNSPTPRFFRKHALSLTFFASKLAPTGSFQHLLQQPAPRRPRRLLPRPKRIHRH